MELKTYPCHGWVIDKATFRRGEIINDAVNSSNYFGIEADGTVTDAGLYYWFMISGSHTHTNVNTKEEFQHRRGWSNKTTPLIPGDYLLSINDPSAIWCFNATGNQDGLPNFDYHYVQAGETFSFEAGARWFFMDGTFTYNNVTRTQPRGFEMSTAATITFDTDAMFIVLKD
tara:strand:+ start:5863 stop:6378 length:516 start_codon:yes stop_codon:yes gene_type:complete